jgi:hypothetical protein
MNYQKIYNQIIERAKTRQLEGYKEKHHIIPKCLGGSNDKENLVELTAREHFLCHMLLCEIYPKNDKLIQALWLMSIGKKRKRHSYFKISNRKYEMLKLKFIQSQKDRKLSLESKEKISKKNSKIIHQYDLQGNFIKSWESILQATAFFTKATSWKNSGDTIGACARGTLKTAYGFIWKFNKENIQDLKYHTDYKVKNKEIEQIDKNNNIINTFTSPKEAIYKLNLSNYMFYRLFSDFNNSLHFKSNKIKQIDLNGTLIKIYDNLKQTKKDGFNPASISQVLNKKTFTSSGFFWDYLEKNTEIKYRLKWK